MGKNKERLNSHNIDLSAILAGIQNLPPAGGEDLQETVEAQTTAVTELMKMVNRKIAMNNGEGQYVWKKCTAPVTIAMTHTNAGSNPSIYQLSSGNVDLSTYTAEDLDGFTGTFIQSSTSKPYSFTATQFTLDTSTFSYTYDASKAQVSVAATIGGGRTYNSMSKSEFVNFIVSNDAETYPNGAVHTDGYWYELIEEKFDLSSLVGCTKMAVDKITFSSRTAGGGMISHSLGENPKVVLLFSKSRAIVNFDVTASIIIRDPSTSYGYGVSIYGYTSAGSKLNSTALQNDSSIMSATAVRAAMNNSIYYTAGVEYTLITMA